MNEKPTYEELEKRVRELERAESERRRMRQAQKMEAIATLTGGIAHDYNNLLSIIVGNLGLAQQDAEPGSDQADFLNEAERAARKVGNLTHELMALSRGGWSIKVLGSLKEPLKRLADEMPPNSGISIEQSISKDLWLVSHDPHKIGSVFKNVFQNAVEAMPDGGTLTISADNLHIDEENADAVPGLKLGDYVHVSFQDQGIGIPEESLDKVFDPYFSTKPMGVKKGMGLGLATAHAIVQKHGGHIDVQSSLDVGTTVHIYLLAEPLNGHGHIPERDEIGPKPAIADQKSEIAKILIMDDEEELRKLAKEMLKRLGYRVETVTDGIAAIDIYRNHLVLGDPFEAVILDLTIKGGMGGEDALKELLKIDPEVKAIVSSGYFNDPVMANYQDYGFESAMAKPYEMKDMKAVLGKVLLLKD